MSQRRSAENVRIGRRHRLLSRRDSCPPAQPGPRTLPRLWGLIAGLLAAVLVLPWPAMAMLQGTDDALPVRIRADVFRYDRRTRILTASGNVVLIYQEITIRAGLLVADLGTGEVRAERDVILEAAGHSVRGAVLTYNLNTRVGVLHEAETAYTGPLVVGSVTLRADRLEGDPRRFATAREAFATTCDPDDPLVSFTAEEITVLVGDKIVGRRVSIWIGDRRVFTLPYFVIFLRERQASRLVPVVGYSEAEGWFVKTSYSYVLTPQSYGFVHADWMERLGVGTGVDHFYETAAGRGAALLYRLANRQTEGVDLRGLLSHTQQLGEVRGTFFADYFSRSLNTGPTSTGLFAAFDVHHSGPANATTVFGSYLQSRAAGLGAAALSATLVDTRTLTRELSTGAVVHFTRTDLPAGRDDELLPRFALTYAGAQALASLVLETRVDLDGELFTGDARYSLERLPEFTLALAPLQIGGGPLFAQLEGGVGRFRETTVGPGGGTVEALRTDLLATVSGPLRLSDRAVLGVRAFARGTLYSTGARRLVYGGRMDLVMPFSDRLEGRVLYTHQSFSGASPFVFDAVADAISYGEASLAYRTSRLFATAAASYDFITRAPGSLTTRMIYAPRGGWTIGAAAIVDLGRRELDRLEASLDLDLGDGWRLEYTGTYDGFARRVVHDRVAVTRVFCDCLAVSLSHLGARGETWLEFWLTAVPWGRGKIGLGGRGNLLFDQPLPFLPRP